MSDLPVEPLVLARGLTKRFGTSVAVDAIDFEVAPGESFGFLGPNGAGKTTTMRCVFGLVVPDRGDVRWEGAPVTERTRLRFGYMPEQRGLYPRMRIGDQLTYFAEQHGMERKAARASGLAWLERLGLAERAVEDRGLTREPIGRDPLPVPEGGVERSEHAHPSRPGRV